MYYETNTETWVFRYDGLKDADQPTMSFVTRAPPPPTKLGRYRQLAPRAAIHVSPLALGALSIGDKWHAIGMGAMDKESSFKLLDAFFDAGGKITTHI
jgi:hypothetical protein